MYKFLFKTFIILGLLLMVEASACDLSYEEAANIALDYIGNNGQEFDQWFDEKSSQHVLKRVERDGFFDEEYNIFFFPLLTIRERYIKGSLWVEVRCNSSARSRYYIEEI